MLIVLCNTALILIILKDFRYHLSHASLMVAKGVPPTEIAKRLGHKNLETTYRTYIHSSDISENKANDIIDDMYN